VFKGLQLTASIDREYGTGDGSSRGIRISKPWAHAPDGKMEGVLPPVNRLENTKTPREPPSTEESIRRRHVCNPFVAMGRSSSSWPGTQKEDFQPGLRFGVFHRDIIPRK
jgi:hypothetical protein